MSTKLFRILVASCGLIGIASLMFSFSINPAPPAGETIQQIVVWGKQHETLILVGSWLQGVGSLLEVLFFLGLLHLAGAMKSLAGWITAFAATVVVGISFVEVSLYLSAIGGGVSGDITTLSVSLNLIKAIQHAYVIAPAPAHLLAMGVVLLRSRLVPRILSYPALLLGTTVGVLGLVGTFIPLQQVIDLVLAAQEVWYAAIAITLIVQATRVSSSLSGNTSTLHVAHA